MKFLAVAQISHKPAFYLFLILRKMRNLQNTPNVEIKTVSCVILSNTCLLQAFHLSQIGTTLYKITIDNVKRT